MLLKMKNFHTVSKDFLFKNAYNSQFPHLIVCNNLMDKNSYFKIWTSIGWDGKRLWERVYEIITRTRSSQTPKWYRNVMLPMGSVWEFSPELISWKNYIFSSFFLYHRCFWHSAVNLHNILYSSYLPYFFCTSALDFKAYDSE